MSDCRKAQELIEKLRDFNLLAEEEAALAIHTATCHECLAYLHAAQTYKSLSSSFTAKDFEIPDDFDRVLAEKIAAATEIKGKRHKFNFWKPAFAFFSLAIILFAGILFFRQPEEPTYDRLVSEKITEAGQPVGIELSYDAAKELAEVSFEIKLGEGISFDSVDQAVQNSRILRWQGSLKQGKNQIPFAVNIPKKGTFTIFTKAQFPGFIHEHKIVLNADGSRVAVLVYESSGQKL